MKHILLFFCLISLTVFSYGQAATSISNGNWISPGTWQGGVVPVPGYNVIINHDVTLGTSWAFSSGSITINAGGSLSQASTGLGMLISSTGTFTNHGTFSFSRLAFTSTTASSNTGTMQNLDSLYVGCDFINSGTITAYAFLPKTVFTNSGTINATNLFNDGTFTNTGNLVLYNLYNNNTMTNNNSISFFDHTNGVIFYNYGTMTGTGNMLNIGSFSNYSTGNINVNVDFSVYPNPSEFFNIENPFNESAVFSVYSPDGRLVAEYDMLPSSHIRIDNLPAGIYLYSLKGSRIYNGKIVKL